MIAMVCMIATVMNPLVSSATVSQVDVDIDGVGGTYEYSDDNSSGFSEGMSRSLDVGKSLSDDKFTITDPTFFNPNRKFEGWVLKVWGTVTDDGGNQWEDWVQLEGTSLMTTKEILAYQVTGDYDSIRFEATYEGDDNDYFSEVQLELFGGTMKITEYQYYLDDKGQEVQESYVEKVSSWLTRLKEDGKTTIKEQTELFDLSATPTKDGATFEGWIQVKIVYEKDDDGDLVRRYECVSDKIYKTEEILAMKVPHDDTIFAAKWSNMEVAEYYGPMRDLSIQGDGGEFSLESWDGGEETNIEGTGFEAKAGLPVSKTLKSLTNPTFFDPDRKFLGWKICEYKEVTTDEGTFYDWVQIPGTKIYSTQDLMSYVIQEGQTELVFMAQWDKDIDEYYSMVSLDAYGGEMKVTKYEEEWDNDKQESVQVTVTETRDYWTASLREDDTTIGAQIEDRVKSFATPTKKGAVFQGWLQFKSTGDGSEDFELVSSKLYTIDEILAMKVPHDDTTFAAKWSDVKVEDYFAPKADNYFDTNNGDMSTTYVDDDGKTVTESINGNFGMTHYAKPTLKEYFEYANVSIHSMKKSCEAFDGWTVTEYEWSDYVSWPVGKEFNIGDPDIKFVCIGTYYDHDKGCVMERWLGMVNYKEYPNKMSTDEIMKLDGTKNHHFIANWKEAHTEITVGDIAATCTKDGYTGDKVCSECNLTLKTGSTITATGHAYKDGVCTNCGDQLVLDGAADDVDTSKPSENVKLVVKKDAIESVTNEIKKVVDAIVSGNVTEEMKNIFSSELIDAIKAKVEAGNKISTEIVATIVTEDKVDAGAAAEIKKNLGENGKLAQYLDLTVTIKSVSADGTEKELGTLKKLDKEITFTIVIPKNLVQDGRVFFVLRNHDGKVDKLSLVKNADGSFSFKTDRFSTYALAYEDVKTTTTDTTASGTNNIAPKTADNSNIILYGAAAVMAAVVLAISKKRNFVK